MAWLGLWPRILFHTRPLRVLVGLAALWPSASLAQVITDRPAIVLDTVVVTATRAERDPLLVPAAIDVVDGTAIRRAQPGLNLAESLPRIPGVLARDRHNQAQDIQISIRGFGARSTFGVRGVRLYTDGIPATMPDGQGQVSHFLLDAAERIEVLRGPLAALYGNGSGGVIQIFSADPPDRPEWRVGPFVGADGLVRGGLGYAARWPRNHSGGIAVDLLELRDDGFREHSEARRTGAQTLGKGTIGAGGSWVFIANSLDARADDPQGLTSAELAANPRASSPNANTFDTRKTTEQRQIGGRVQHGLGSAVLSAGAYGGTREIEQFLSVPVAAQSSPLHGGGVVDLDRDYVGADLRLRWPEAFHTSGLAVSAGVEHQISDERRRGYENFFGSRLGVRGALRRDEDDRVTGTAGYTLMEWAPTSRWRADAGVRQSRVRFRSEDHYITTGNPDDSGALTYGRTTPAGGILWRAAPWLSLYGSAGTGFETPTFSEVAYRNDGGSGLNTTLRPARSANFETGARGRRGRIAFGLAAFESRTEDELVVAGNQGGRTTYTNAARTRRRGGEFSGSYVAARWRAAVAYTYLDARFRRDFAGVPAGSRIPGIPRHDLWTEVGGQPIAGLDLALTATALDRVWANDANTASAPGFVLLDVSGEKELHLAGARFVGFLRVANLLDRKAVGSVIVNESNGRYFEAAPGRAWFAGLRAELAHERPEGTVPAGSRTKEGAPHVDQ